MIYKGTIDVDQAALTGESLPITMYTGDSCKMVILLSIYFILNTYSSSIFYDIRDQP